MNDTNDAVRIRRRVWIILLAVVALYGLLRLAFGPLPQDPAYHLFADSHARLGGIPYTANVMTNLAILAAGIFGLALRTRMTISPDELSAVNVLIAASILTAFGSAYYHWEPTNATLFWDRLPISIVLMSLFALVMADRVHPLFALDGLWPFTALGAASVILWSVTEAMGQGDLLLYLVFRFGTGAVIVLLMILRQSRHTGSIWLAAAVVCEVFMVTFERHDYEVFKLTGGTASGHNLKHIMAGLGLVFVFWWLRARRTPSATTGSGK